MKRISVVFALAVVLLLSGCRSDMDRDVAAMVTDSLNDLSVTVWGEYPLTTHYTVSGGASVDIPVTVVDGQGFEALADGAAQTEYEMLVVSGEIIGEDLFTPERIARFNALLDRGVVIFFITDSETMANRIALEITGGEWEHSAGDSRSIQHSFSIFRVKPDDPSVMGTRPGDDVLGGIHAMDSFPSVPRSELDALMLRRVLDPYRTRTLSAR